MHLDDMWCDSDKTDIAQVPPSSVSMNSSSTTSVQKQREVLRSGNIKLASTQASSSSFSSRLAAQSGKELARRVAFDRRRKEDDAKDAARFLKYGDLDGYRINTHPEVEMPEEEASPEQPTVVAPKEELAAPKAEKADDVHKSEVLKKEVSAGGDDIPADDMKQLWAMHEAFMSNDSVLLRDMLKANKPSSSNV